MGLREFVAKLGMSKDKFRAMKQEQRFHKVIEDREKTSNERALERIMEDRRQEMIKAKLRQMQQSERDNLWRGNVFANNDNAFSGANVFVSDESMLKAKAGFFRRGEIV